jgi:NAD(P)-dependent dehydrogenase (short-subunit alcohol dehydrogenase family)
LAEEGAEVVATSRALANVERTCAQVESATGHRPLGLALGVRDSEAVEATMAGVSARHGRIDVLVSNAGTELSTPRASSTRPTTTGSRSWASTRPAPSTRAAPLCATRPTAGAIVTVGSISGLITWENDAAYCASKGAVIQLARAIALDMAPHNIRANCVCPGVIDTPMAEGFIEQADDPAGVPSR